MEAGNQICLAEQGNPNPKPTMRKAWHQPNLHHKIHKRHRISKYQVELEVKEGRA
jgi:hypothetical protein